MLLDGLASPVESSPTVSSSIPPKVRVGLINNLVKALANEEDLQFTLNAYGFDLEQEQGGSVDYGLRRLFAAASVTKLLTLASDYLKPDDLDLLAAKDASLTANVEPSPSQLVIVHQAIGELKNVRRTLGEIRQEVERGIERQGDDVVSLAIQLNLLDVVVDPGVEAVLQALGSLSELSSGDAARLAVATIEAHGDMLHRALRTVSEPRLTSAINMVVNIVKTALDQF